MNDRWLMAAENLAAILEDENQALAALDLPRAAGMLMAKTICIDEFQAQPANLCASDHATAVAMLERLAVLAAENRRLLDRGIKAQGQVIGVMANLVRQTPMAPRYGAKGALRRECSPLTLTFSAQA